MLYYTPRVVIFCAIFLVFFPFPSTSKVTSPVGNVKKANKHAEIFPDQSEGSVFFQVDENGKKVLTYYGLMTAGAIARTVSATAVHPLNVIKIMLQKKGGVMPDVTWETMTRGAGSQFLWSLPHGAVNFAVTETTKKQLNELTSASSLCKRVPKKILDPALDFFSSSVSTIICSVISTPQMVVTDRIMAGIYPNMFVAISSIATTEGLRGFYMGWLPALVQKIPSYALTWMFFQQLKLMFLALFHRVGSALENTLIGSIAAACACCVMIPIDTVKTRIITQNPGVQIYKGMWHCLLQIINEEGVWSLYKSLAARLGSVAPMMGVQFAVYELMKRVLLNEPPALLVIPGGSKSKKIMTVKNNNASGSVSQTTMKSALATLTDMGKELWRSW